jgi:hypothetical protein
VVAPPPTDREGLFAGLREPAGFTLRFAGSGAEASRALGDPDLVLLLAAPEVPTGEVDLLLADKTRRRPELPLLVLRNRQAEEPAGWARGGVGVLRCPLLPAALRGSVDVVLGLGLAEARP